VTQISVGTLVDEGFASIQTGPFGTQLKAAEYTEHGRPLLNVRNVGFGDVRDNDLEFVSDETADRLRSHILEPGDIVFGRKGAVERHAFIPARFGGAVQGSDCIRLRLDERRMVPRFVSFALRRPRHLLWMQNQCSHGATMASLNQDIVRRIELPDLPVEKQHQVVGVLGAIDDLVENNRRRIALLEQMAQAIYREWFVHFRYPGREHDELVDSPLGPIPHGWKAEPFALLGTFLNGFAFKPEHWGRRGAPIIKIRELKDGITPSTPRYDGDEVPARFWIVRGDLLFSWSGHLDAYIWPWEPGWLNQHLFHVIPADRISKPWLFLSLRDRMEAFRSRSQGTTMKHIKRAALGEVLVAKPPNRVADAFDEVASCLNAELLALAASLRQLASLRDILLPKLVTGAIDVSRLDLEALIATDAAA
jgi:type I restriction enzyme, S subunit